MTIEPMFMDGCIEGINATIKLANATVTVDKVCGSYMSAQWIVIVVFILVVGWLLTEWRKKK